MYLPQESGNNEVVLMLLDLGSLKSVRCFAETFLKTEPRLDLLINNAGEDVYVLINLSKILLYNGQRSEGWRQYGQRNPFFLISQPMGWAVEDDVNGLQVGEVVDGTFRFSSSKQILLLATEGFISRQDWSIKQLKECFWFSLLGCQALFGWFCTYTRKGTIGSAFRILLPSVPLCVTTGHAHQTQPQQMPQTLPIIIEKPDHQGL